MIKYLKCDIKKFTHIVHVADIHIRLTKRHDEYRQIFDKLYTAIDKTPPGTIIAVLGDIFHNKSELTPECVRMGSVFFNELAHRRPTVVIAGNHDATLNNKNRLDSLTPVIDANNHPNLYYLKESGLFVLGDVLFNNYSIFDDFTKYIPHKNIPDKIKADTKHHIALYHGPVQDAVTDVGYRVTSKTVNNDTFEGHDIVLLGDIHRFQKLQERSVNYNQPVILYPGSLVQQNHGEDLAGHGYVLWDLESYQYEQHDIPNDYGFFTIAIDKGQLLSDVSNMPKKVLLRAKCNQTIASDVKTIIRRLQDTHEIVETVYEKTECVDGVTKNIIDTTNINITSISDIGYQNELISKYLKTKAPHITDAMLGQVFNINVGINNSLPKELVLRNIRWKPKVFQFENMFAYGEGNSIDFSKMKNIIGLFANNAHGKSSILSALCYCLFDKCAETFKASQILNAQKMSFNCRFNFEISGVDYFIERKGTQDRKGAVKVDVKFYKKENGKEIDLKGDDRRDTNDIIRDYIGTYEDFILTVLSVQKATTENFIDMKQADRKDLIAKFMGITIFDKLDTLAKEQSKEINTLLKNYVKTDYPVLLAKRIQEIMIFEKNITTENITLAAKTDKLKDEKERLSKEFGNLQHVTSVNLNIDALESRLARLKTQRAELEEFEKVNQNKAKLCKDELDRHTAIKSSIDIDVAEKTNREYESYVVKLEANNRKLETVAYDIREKNKKLERLKQHKYDPNCNFCVNNIFVLDAIATENELIDINKNYKLIEEEGNRLKNSIENTKWASVKTAEFRQVSHTILKLQNELQLIENTILKNQTACNAIILDIENVDRNIKLYHVEKSAIENNIMVNGTITFIKNNISRLEDAIKESNRILIELNGKLTVCVDQKTTYEEAIKTAKSWELQQEAYGYYLMAVSRDGIPYDLISQALPTIEAEINNTLNQIVEFTIELKTDGKSVIGYINKNGVKWALELCSGLERFVSSLAIRVALMNLSNLPRPNFIAIDEGFGCADAENLNGMSPLLGYFKTNFDFVWIVSHLSVMKDMADTILEIKKEHGFSRIVFP